MNVYVLVEGNETEMSVYPEWLSILVPHLQRINNPWKIDENNYYLFSGGGIPNIFHHIVNAIADINQINTGDKKFDYLMVCLDTEQESREYVLEQIESYMKASDVRPQNFQLKVFVQKVCMETWFLGNRKVFKNNPQDKNLIDYVNYYNVANCDPEQMGSYNECFSTIARFHYRYLTSMLAERHIRYSKKHTKEVCNHDYLNELIKRYEDTKQLQSFGAWYDFVCNNL